MQVQNKHTANTELQFCLESPGETQSTKTMSSCSPEKLTPNPYSWTNLFHKNKKTLNQAVFAMLSNQTPKSQITTHIIPSPKPNKTLIFDFSQIVSDRTSLLSDEILLHILSKLPDSQRNSNSLVSKRWLNLQGRLVRSIKLLDWKFLKSGRFFFRFPNLIHVNLLHGCVISPERSPLLVNHKLGSFHIDSNLGSVSEKCVLPVDEIDSGLRILAGGYPNLRKLLVVNASEMGLLSVAEECPTLQELVLHRCNDQVLRGIAAFGNLQILNLVGNVDGYYGCLVSDVGLTILAQGCKRLVKLELRGCGGSYDGVRAIGQCCQMLEELTFYDHGMDDGWLSAVSYCANLKTLRFISCKSIDRSPGFDDHLGFCPALERLHLERCQLRDKHSVRALFLVCRAVKEIVFLSCWGFEDGIFNSASLCRRVKFLSLEGCSKVTTQGLECVVVSWNELESLRVVSCNKVKDSEVSPTLPTCLKELKWRPDSKSQLLATLSGTGMGKRGGKFFKKMQI